MLGLVSGVCCRWGDSWAITVSTAAAEAEASPKHSWLNLVKAGSSPQRVWSFLAQSWSSSLSLAA